MNTNKTFFETFDGTKMVALSHDGKLCGVTSWGYPGRWIIKWPVGATADQIRSNLKEAGLEGVLGDFIFLESQNMTKDGLPEEAIILFSDNGDRSQNRGSDLKHFYLLLKAKWVYGRGRGGVIETSDGKKFRVRGAEGNPHDTSSMYFVSLSEKEFDEYIELKEEEKRAEEATREAEQKAEEERKEVEYLIYRSSIRGLTEGLGLSIIERKNVATSMPPVHMVCRNVEDYSDDDYKTSFELIASFVSENGPFAFLRSIVKYVHQTNGGRIDREAWEGLNLEKALSFALEERERHNRKRFENEMNE